MRNARRLLLSLLLSSPSRIRLVKLAFLVSHVLRDSGYAAPYDFVPYKYGPFSFVLYRDLSKLIESGWVVENDGIAVACGKEGEVACSPKLDPGVMRVSTAPRGKEILDERTEAAQS